MPPLPLVRKLYIPFVNRVLTSHTHITPTANRNQIINCRLSAFAFRDVVSTLEIESVNLVLTPFDSALAVESFSHDGQPDLFAQCLGNLCFSVR